MSVASTVAWILGALIGLYLVAGVIATVATYWLDKQTSSPQRMQKSTAAFTLFCWPYVAALAWGVYSPTQVEEVKNSR
jgi:hypothetical protein